MTLELCPNGSLMSMFCGRRVFTELEALCFMVQLIGTCLYMHTHQVIHHDLKLGNLFRVLDGETNVEVGDFGLAALSRVLVSRRRLSAARQTILP